MTNRGIPQIQPFQHSRAKLGKKNRFSGALDGRVSANAARSRDLETAVVRLAESWPAGT
jgi:hypothetical protein